ncbi:MAG: pyridoxamine kinase, partial [Oscillospiraceae bacterium]
MPQKTLRAAAIHDISGIGKCSLTVALPILSVMGVETAVLPTAILSAHTGFSGFTYRDLTEDMPGIAAHWKKEGAAFDALYSGFLGSVGQIQIVSDIFDAFKTNENLLLVDPVMGDGGKLYQTYTEPMAQGVVELCKKADIIVPNMTEAAYIVGEPYESGPYRQEDIEKLLKKLSRIGPKQVVLTGVWFREEAVGSACYCRETGEIHYCFYKKYPGYFHGTGDIFGSVLLGGILNGLPVAEAQALAAEFVGLCIQSSMGRERNPQMGVCFERCLPWLLQKLQKRLEKADGIG